MSVLRYRLFNPESVRDCELVARWSNDPEIRPFMSYFPNEAAYAELSSPEKVALELGESARHGVKRYMIILDGFEIGEMSLQLDARQCMRRAPDTAWLSITLGEASARGRGLGSLAMKQLEAYAWQAGAARAELGVFEFNERAHRLYKSLGYQEIGRVPEFTWHQGRLWTDIRLLKEKP